MFDFEYNNETSLNHAVLVAKRPDIPLSRSEVEFIEVPGREKLIERKNVYDDIDITVSCGFKAEKTLWNKKVREIHQWLKPLGELRFSDDDEVFYKVKDIQITEVKRETKKIGKFEVKFICSPFVFLVEGKRQKTVNEILYNPYSLCCPTYLIKGEGTCSLNVNGNTMTAVVGQNLTINTEMMIAYREDGALRNIMVTGNYDDLYLNPGKNSVNITKGFELAVIPNWRYM